MASLPEKRRSQDFRDQCKRVPALVAKRAGGADPSCYLSLTSVSRHVIFLIDCFLFRSADLAGLRCQLEGGS